MRQATHQLTKDPVMLKILDELKKQKKTGKELEIAIGLGNGTVSRWKYADMKSYMRYIDCIAEFLNVTPEYLQSQPEKQADVDNLTDTEKWIIDAFRRMELNKKKCMLETIEIFIDSSELKRMKNAERS